MTTTLLGLAAIPEPQSSEQLRPSAVYDGLISLAGFRATMLFRYEG